MNLENKPGASGIKQNIKMNANIMKKTSTTIRMTLKLFGLVLVLGAMSVLLGLTGCNTAHGFGKDMQKAGEGIQDGTR